VSVLESLHPIIDDLAKRFGPQLNKTVIEHGNEVYIDTSMEAVPALCAYFYRMWEARLAGLFADDRTAEMGIFHIYYQFAFDAFHAFIFLRVPISKDAPKLTSLTNAIPAVNWQEREIKDLFGFELVGHPNPNRCAMHDDWPAVFPLRKDFSLHTKLPAFSGPRHRFRPVEGEGVFQVPVGPVHAGIIEPGHFLFSVAGEPILYLQIRLFYTHKGTEKLFESIPIEHGVRLAESISGDSAFAHATAFCHAVERASNTQVPVRARSIRSLCLELERLYNHIADIGAIANDVAFAIANTHAMRLRETLLQLNEHLTGNRMLRGMACLGGVRSDWNQEQIISLSTTITDLLPDFESMVQMIHASSSVRDRLETTGTLHPQTAKDLGIVGIAGRASGYNHDLRRDFPNDSYDQVTVSIPVYTTGDVFHRVQVRIDEVRESCRIIHELIGKIPSGPVCNPVKQIPPDQVALGCVEGWRGEIFHWIRTASGNRLSRCKIKDPSLQNWPALSEAVQGNIVPDFPVINKSFNLSYSGTDR